MIASIKNYFNTHPLRLAIFAGLLFRLFATIFSNLGRTKVYLIDKADRILPFEDEDIAALISESLQKHGATIHHGSSLKIMEIKKGKVEYELEYKDGKTEIITVDKALVSI